MKKAVKAGFVSFVFVVLLSLVIGSSIRQSFSVNLDSAAGGNSHELFSLVNEAGQTEPYQPESTTKAPKTEEIFSLEEETTANSEKLSSSNEEATVYTEPSATLTVSNTVEEEPPETFTASNIVEVEVPEAFTESNTAETEAVEEITKPSPEINAASPSETVVNARFGTNYKYKLDSSSSVILFNIKVTERGVLSYTLSPVGTSVGSWNAELFGEYYINGSGETALRSLNVLSVSSSDAMSPNIGLMQGNYVIKVTAGAVFSDSAFELKINFSPGTEYEIEFNDSATRYTEISPGVPIKGSASYYSSGQDADWFMFRSSGEAYFSLSFSHEELTQSTVAFKVTLYNSDMAELFSGNSLLSSSVISSENIGLPEGVYFISVVSRVYTDVDYTLSLEKHSSYKFETELNDNKSSADSLLPDVPVRGSISSRSGISDKDFFSFTIKSSGYIKAEMKNVVPTSSYKNYIRRISLTDASGNIIFSSLIADNAKSVSSPNIGLAAGTYFIIIDDSDIYHSSSDYELSFSFTETNGWEKEYNNTPQLATPIYEDIPVSGSISNAGTDFDTDYFAITAENAGKMTVNFSHSKGTTGREIFRISVYNQKMEQVGSVLSSNDNKESVSADFDITAGTYYIKVTSGSYSSDIRYYLTCSFK